MFDHGPAGANPNSQAFVLPHPATGTSENGVQVDLALNTTGPTCGPVYPPVDNQPQDHDRPDMMDVVCPLPRPPECRQPYCR